MNKKFGKIENGKLVFAPSVIIIEDKQIISNDASVYLLYGYKQIVREPYPQGTEIVYKEHYVENDTTITISWTEDLEATRQYVLGKIAEFDTSDEVNSFEFGDTIMWIDRDTRVSLSRSLDICEKKGDENYNLCVEGVGVVTLPIITIKEMLNEIEVYAIKCYEVTFNHKRAVEALKTCEEVAKYDYKANYPERPVFNL